MRKTGFIQLSREFLNWQWYDDGTAARVFLHLLLTANFEKAQWHGITIERGQRGVSLAAISEETGIPRSTVRDALAKLEKGGEIERTIQSGITVITLKNYELYTSARTETAPFPSDDRTAPARHPHTYYNNKYNKNNNYNNDNNMRSREKNNHSFDIDELERRAYDRYRKKSVDI